MGRANEMARNLLQQEPGRARQHEKPADAPNVGIARAPRQHHETADAYTQVVARLSESWRVILCKDGIQWILQRRDAVRSGQPRWRATGYFRTKRALILASRTACGLIAPSASVILNALPARIGGDA